jgi:hypothetical protein
MIAGKTWMASSVFLAAAGILLIGVGLYFILLRPALLPEDIRYMNLTAAEVQSIAPRLGQWLTQVFRVMGGYIAATGVLALTLAATSFREHRPSAALGVSVGGAVSIGWMAAINFLINSDFKWALLAMALVWACSLVLFVRELLRPISVKQAATEA